jgi:glycosyltransferase involved in cell wall biosynthesis
VASGARPVVALVTDAILPYHRGGKEVRYREIASRLADRADVHVYTMNWWRGASARREDGVTLHAISPMIPLYAGERRSVRQAVVFALSCLKLLWHRFDVIEADHMPYMQLFVLRLVASLRRKRLVATWHECWGRDYWQRYMGRPGVVGWWLERLAMALPDHIVAASEETARRLREDVPPRIGVSTAPNGVDLALIARTPPATRRSDVIAVGRMLSHKRFDLLIDTLALLRDEGDPVFCRIVGDGPERDALHRLASERGVDHLIEFHHDVADPAELYGLLKASRAFAFPSEREGFGIAALEALACGLPVVTTSAPDNLARELVGRAAAGVVCEPNAEALAAALRSALAPAPPPPPEAWIQEFDWSAVTDHVWDVLVAEPARGARSPEIAADHV